jgi:hypothetical protein
MSERLNFSDAGRRVGCDEKQIRRGVQSGRLHPDEHGLISVEELDAPWRRVNRRTIAKIGAARAANARSGSDISGNSDTAEIVREDETPAQAAERIVTAGGAMLTIDEAVKRKENYLGLLKQLEYDQKSGAVVSVADISKVVGEEYAKVRTRLLAIPSERAPAIHRLKTVVEVEEALRTAIVRALEELTRDGVSADV